MGKEYCRLKVDHPPNGPEVTCEYCLGCPLCGEKNKGDGQSKAAVEEAEELEEEDDDEEETVQGRRRRKAKGKGRAAIRVAAVAPRYLPVPQPQPQVGAAFGVPVGFGSFIGHHHIQPPPLQFQPNLPSFQQRFHDLHHQINHVHQFVQSQLGLRHPQPQLQSQLQPQPLPFDAALVASNQNPLLAGLLPNRLSPNPNSVHHQPQPHPLQPSLVQNNIIFLPNPPQPLPPLPPPLPPPISQPHFSFLQAHVPDLKKRGKKRK